MGNYPLSPIEGKSLYSPVRGKATSGSLEKLTSQFRFEEKSTHTVPLAKDFHLSAVLRRSHLTVPLAKDFHLSPFLRRSHLTVPLAKDIHLSPVLRRSPSSVSKGLSPLSCGVEKPLRENENPEHKGVG